MRQIRLLWQGLCIGWHVYRSARQLYAEGHKAIWVRTVVVPADFEEGDTGVLKWDEKIPPLPPQEE